jgi:O-antigen biosynthesis protein WbqP
MKRTFDFILALIILIPALVVCAFCSIIIMLETRSSPIFVQRRLGKHEKTFNILKLRTMKVGSANVASHEIEPERITRVGSLLRKVKFDELPQILNVLSGQMSFVGPRPGLPNHAELTKARVSHDVFSLVPGITGPAQLAGLDMSTPEQLAAVDATYIGDWSFAGDMHYIWLTLTGGGRGDAAHRSK